MKTEIQEMDGKLIAMLEGEMDTAAAIEAEMAMKPLFEANGRDVVILAPNGEFNVGVNINLCIIRMDPAGLFSCVDLIQNDVVWSQETDSEIVFFVRIDRR